MDRDREILRLPNGSTVQGEEHTSSIAVEGWEKSKMKKKRSGIKPDTTGGSSTSKPIDGHREPKQGLQSRLIADGNLRFNDTHGFRCCIKYQYQILPPASMCLDYDMSLPTLLL